MNIFKYLLSCFTLLFFIATGVYANDSDKKKNYDTENLIKIFDYNDIGGLEQIFEDNPHEIASVVLEPTVFNKPKNNFLKNVQKISKYFHYELKKIQNEYPKIIKDVRGVGLLIGLQLFHDQTKFIQKLMDNNFLTIRAGENVIRLLPPLTVKKQEIDLAIKIIKKVCKEYK